MTLHPVAPALLRLQHLDGRDTHGAVVQVRGGWIERPEREEGTAEGHAHSLGEMERWRMEELH